MVYIKLDNASVTFSIYNSKTRSIRTHLAQAIGAKLSSIDSTVYVKALDNISLELREGDRVALIGHNGAGKSTMLKLLSGVYEPTEGEIAINGNISSLTDITMGMDPENSGYENIIMRCVFMGMTFKQAKEKAQSIIDFSELSEYIDLPLRTYSTGMYMRLAFTIATSIVPDILIMDEMIGTGDRDFIEKAKQRSISLIEQTKIMVISSHDLRIIRSICNRAIWLEKGRIIMDDGVEEVINVYEQQKG